MRRVAIPLKKTAKRCAAMAELRLLFRAQLGKGFSNLRKIKQRIVAEAIGAAWSIEDDALGCTAEDRKRFSIASGGDDANRSEEHTSELQSQSNLVCRLLLEKKKN